MTAAAPDRDAERLARLAELDMSAAEHVHAQLVAATGPDEVANLSRAWQRTARSLRQTLALKAKLTREAAQAEARAKLEARWKDEDAGDYDMDAHDPAELPFVERICGLQDAVGRIAYETIPEEERREALLDRFDAELDDWREEDDFLTADLDAQVVRACRLLGLPEDLAPRWRDLADPHADPAFAAADDPPISDLNVVGGVHCPPWRPSG